MLFLDIDYIRPIPDPNAYLCSRCASGYVIFAKCEVCGHAPLTELETPYQVPDPQYLQDTELAGLAIIIARNLRNEDYIQPLRSIRIKYWHEILEFIDARDNKMYLDLLSELADLVYYLCQEYQHTHSSQDYVIPLHRLAQLVNVTDEQAYAVALAKYQLTCI